MFRRGNVFGRIDLGADLNLYFDANGIEDDAYSLVIAAISVRAKGGNVHPHGSLVIPLDENVGDIFDLGILAGVEFGF